MLDAIRLLAAAVVLVGHLNIDVFLGRLPWGIPLHDYMADAVMVFFVLSGFVIAYVIERKESTARAYFSARIARLASVAWPALLLTLLLDTGGRWYFSNFYNSTFYIPADLKIIRLLAGGLFLNEVWFLQIHTFSNGPFWSLGYEFWFYVVFGLWYFFPAKRRIYVTLACLVAGPKILLLYPIWFLGYALYGYLQKANWSVGKSTGLAVFFVLAYAAYRSSGVAGHTTELLFPQHMHVIYRILGKSTNLIDCYLVALVFGGFLTSVYLLLQQVHLKNAGGVPGRIVRQLSSYSFSIYAVHYPVLVLVAACYSASTDSATRTLAFFGAALACAILISKLSDRFKGAMKRFVVFLWDAAATRMIKIPTGFGI